MKNMGNISYDYNENLKINDIIDYAMTFLAHKTPNPFIQKALTQHQNLYKLASQIGVNMAQEDIVHQEYLKQLMTSLINKDRENK